MNKLIGCVVLLAAGIVSSPAKASTYSTTWTYQVYYGGSQVKSTSGAPQANQAITMPVGSLWTCTKIPVMTTPGGYLYGSIACETNGASATISATCLAAGFNQGNGSAMVFNVKDSKNLVVFTVKCETTMDMP